MQHKTTDTPLCFTYRNYRGEVAERRVIPGEFYWGNTEFHEEDQWMLRAYDLDKESYRDFAVRDILSFGGDPRQAKLDL